MIFKPKEWLLLFLVAFLPFLFVFARGELVGADTFANFNYVCGFGTYVPPVFWGSLLSWFPCSVFVVQFVEFLSYFLVLVLVAVFGRSFFGVEGWKLGVFAGGLCPLLFQVSLNFEAQWFGFVFGWLGFVGFVVFLRRKFNNKLNKLLALLFFLLVLLYSYLIWAGSLLIFIALSFYCIILLAISIPIIIINANNLLNYALHGSIFSNQPIAEEMPLLGATPTILLWPFINKIPKTLLIPAIFLFIIGMIKVKYMFLAVPLLACGILVIDIANKNMKILGKFKWPNIVLICLFTSTVFGYMAYQSEPTPNQTQLYIQAIKESKDTNTILLNDWSIGWNLQKLGYNTQYNSSYPNPDYNNIKQKYLALTSLNIDKNCFQKNKVGQIKLLICS